MTMAAQGQAPFSTLPVARKQRRRRVPSILQFEASECGAASLAMILAFFGAWVPLEQLRVACGVSRDGVKASNMLKAARGLGLAAKGFKKEIDTLAELPWPVVLYWNFNHFVVFEGFANGQAWINDPARGPRSVSMQEFDRSFTGLALAFERGPDFVRTSKPAGVITGLAARLSGSKKAFAFIMLVSLALVVPGVVIPAFAKAFVDGIIVEHQDRWLIPLLIIMTLAAIVNGLLTLVQQRVLVKLETKLAVVGASRFVWHVMRLPMSFFTQRHTGEISNRIAANDRVAKLLSGQFATTLVDLGTAFFFAVVMLTYDVVLGALVVGLAIPNYFILRALRRRMIQSSRTALSETGKLGAASIGAIHNIETVKASGLEWQAFERWSGYHANVINAMRQVGSQSVVFSVIPSLLKGLTVAAILGLGAWRVITGILTIGDLVAFQLLAQSFTAPIGRFVGLGGMISSIRADLQRIEDALRNEVDPAVGVSQKEAPAEPLAAMRGEVEVVDLSFGYSRLEPPLLEGANIRLAPGMRVAIVGGSGSGKSTLGRLICGLLEPWTGEILFDGRPSRNISQTDRARSLAYVDQDVFLFAGTVRDNLTLWNRSRPEEDITRALADAAILDDVSVRPGQLAAVVEEGGKNFSGGQRQRLEIARALVSNPAILVLDEATAALDASTEKIIDDNLRRRGCTCIIIAHRLSTIRDCDEIIVLKRGKVVERGTHENLMVLEGEYANLIRSA